MKKTKRVNMGVAMPIEQDIFPENEGMTKIKNMMSIGTIPTEEKLRSMLRR